MGTNNSDQQIVDALTEVFSRKRPVTLFAGAGVSMRAGLPDWKDLLRGMAESIRSSDALTANKILECVIKGNLTLAAEYFWLTDNVLEGDKGKYLKSILSDTDASPLKPLAALPFANVITTNFDRAIFEAYAAEKNISPKDHMLGNPGFLSAQWDNDTYVARIHGGIEFPSGMVLSSGQFSRLLENQKYIDFLTSIFTNGSVVFLGFSFYDPAIKFVLEQIDKKHGPDHDGRHLAILPDDNASELVQKASRLNIKVIKYDPKNNHIALWGGIAAYAKTVSKNSNSSEAATWASHSSTKKYLASCYARASIGKENHIPLSEIVLEGVISALLQECHPKSLGEADIREGIRRTLGIKGADVKSIIDRAIKALVEEKLVRKHREIGLRGTKYAWHGVIDGEGSLSNDIDVLTGSVCDRAYVQEGWKPPQHVTDTVRKIICEIVHKRGWDLGAAFASGRAPDNVSIDQILDTVGSRLAAFDRERIQRTLESLFQRPTMKEASLLAELGRVSFALELTFQTPRSALFHKNALPRKLYFDANLLLPAFVEGHPQSKTYNTAIDQLRKATNTSGIPIQCQALYGYLNEMVSHRNAALAYAREAGKEMDSLAISDAAFHGPGNINVYVGAYANATKGKQSGGFDAYLQKVAPYTNERELEKWIEKKGISIIRGNKTNTYSRIYQILERSNARRLENGKKPILIEHDALQLARLNEDYEARNNSLFVTADRQLYEDIASSEYSHLANYMISNVGIVQLVDLLIGSQPADQSRGELLWSGKVSDKSNKMRAHITRLALGQYDAAIAMKIPAVVEATAEKVDKELARQSLDLESENPKIRLSALRTLGTFEDNFFSGMSETIEKERKKKPV